MIEVVVQETVGRLNGYLIRNFGHCYNDSEMDEIAEIIRDAITRAAHLPNGRDKSIQGGQPNGARINPVVRTAYMSFDKKVLLKIIAPLVKYASQDIYAASKKIQSMSDESDEIYKDVSEVVRRIGNMASLIELVMSDDFEERAAQLLDADGTSVADNSTSKSVENDTK